MSDEMAIKLEFYVHIYFAIYPIHPLLKGRLSAQNKTNTKYSREELLIFKKYLNAQGNELSKMNDLLPYFALPLVKDPLTHPTFSKIFSHDWVFELRSQLVDFLNSMYSANNQPFLVHMYTEYMKKQEIGISQEELEKIKTDNKDYEVYVNELESNNRELVDILQDYHNKYKELEDYVKDQRNEPDNDRGSVIIQQKWATFSMEILRLARDVYSFAKKKCKLAEDKTDESKFLEYDQKLDQFQGFLTLNMNDLMMNLRNQEQKQSQNNQYRQPDEFSMQEVGGKLKIKKRRAPG